MTPFAAGLVVRAGDDTQVFSGDHGPVSIGRDALADVRIDDPRISRVHLKAESVNAHWQLVDTSRNGIYLDGRPVSSLTVDGPLTLRLGDPVYGSELRFDLAPAPAVDLGDQDGDDATETTSNWRTGELDPGVIRAGAATAARRRRLNISQRSLAADGIINAGALIAFEKGRSWPREATRAKLEEILQWPPGAIAQIRSTGLPPAEAPAQPAAPAPPDTAPVTDSVTSQLFTADGEIPVLVQAVLAGVDGCDLAIATAPPPHDSGFQPRVGQILAEIRQLESVAMHAVAGGHMSPVLAEALSRLRGQYDQLMARSAAAPQAPAGHRLYAARRRANLSAGEAARAGGLTEDVIGRAEAGAALDPAETSAVEALIGRISWV